MMLIALRIKVKCLGLWKKILASEFMQRTVLGDIQRWIVALIWIAFFIALLTFGARERRKGAEYPSSHYHRAMEF